jgi:hypothetical protein
MKLLQVACFVLVFFIFALRNGSGQTFMNLNFELANVSGYLPGEWDVPTTAAFPDWSFYLGSTSDPAVAGPETVVDYDELDPLNGSDEPNLVLVDPNVLSGGYWVNLPPPIQGNYSAIIEGSSLGGIGAVSASIGQIGTIPGTAQSLVFSANIIFGSLDVSFDGQALSLVTIRSEPNYAEYGADVSSFAGETGQLLFTAPSGPNDYEGSMTEIDSISFSSSPVPEPSLLALTALGGFLFGVGRLHKLISN